MAESCQTHTMVPFEPPARPETLVEQVDAQLSAIAAERDRIAGELHDDSIQAMTAVSLQLQRLARRELGEAELEILEKCRQLTDSAIGRLRHVLFVLHPSTLDDEGLVGTLETYFESYVADDHPTLDWSVTGDHGLSMPTGVAALAFRLARAAIGNALVHAEASRIDVAVSIDAHELVVSVRDDGVGFDPASIRKRPGHLGIPHSQALAAAALGIQSVESAPGCGTAVTIRLPIG